MVDPLSAEEIVMEGVKRTLHTVNRNWRINLQSTYSNRVHIPLSVVMKQMEQKQTIHTQRGERGERVGRVY